MKPPLLFSLFTLTLPLIMHAQEPVFDIPRIDNKAPAGKTGEAIEQRLDQLLREDGLAQKAFHVSTLASDSGEAGLAQFSLAWNEKGLLVHVAVMEMNPLVEAEDDKKLADKDSVEIFFGGKKGSGQYYQLTTSAGMKAAKDSKIRFHVDDLRKTPSDQKPAPEVKGGESEKGSTFAIYFTGYDVDVLLPWSDVGVTPKAGEEATFQLCVNSIDAAGRKTRVTWHPGYHNHQDPNAMYRIRLAEKASPPVRLAVRATLDHGRPRVDVIAPHDFAGKPAVLKAKEKTAATGAFESEADHARATFIAPETATDVSVEGQGKAQVDFTPLPDLIYAGILNVRPYFKQSVFSGEKFPVCDIEKPEEAEKTLGKCSLSPTFYDADYNEVKTAAKPGRYGAIIRVQTANGQKFNRYATLYRAPEELLGRTLHPEFADVKLPPELGIDPTVVSSHLQSVGDLFGHEFRIGAGMSLGPEAAVLLAWLSEIKADAAPDLRRTGPNEADQKWWYGLKKKTGNLRTDYFVHLPPDYDKDPQKKWPVILFLHGSGERGYDLKLLARQPLVQGVDERKDFPFILVAPQVSPGEWWSIPELDDLLDGLPAKYRIDPDRIYLTGLSMGGFATWSYLAAEPERFAAAVPICGGGDPADVARFKDMPIWVFHGGKDDAVPIQRSQEMVDALKKAGSSVKFTVFPDVDHFSWIPAYKDQELFKWLLEQKRQAK